MHACMHACRDPVYDMAWLQTKTGTEAMTVSSDGKALWWDTRRLAEPTEELRLMEKGSEQALGAVCLDYSPAAGPTKSVARLPVRRAVRRLRMQACAERTPTAANERCMCH